MLVQKSTFVKNCNKFTYKFLSSFPIIITILLQKFYALKAFSSIGNSRFFNGNFSVFFTKIVEVCAFLKKCSLKFPKYLNEVFSSYLQPFRSMPCPKDKILGNSPFSTPIFSFFHQNGQNLDFPQKQFVVIS